MWRHQKTRSVCVKQALNTRRWLVNALVTWHVSYKITTLLRLKLFEKIHIHKNVSRTLESVLSHCDPAYAVREKLTIEKPFVESALAIILWLKHEVNKEIGKNLFVNNGYNAQ